jgi:integration host factor subunit alpha
MSNVDNAQIPKINFAAAVRSVEKTPVSNSVTRADLADAVYRAMGQSRREAADMVETVLGEIADTLVAGETVKLSSFGVFLVRSKVERRGRNPKTGVEARISPRRVVLFKPSQSLKAKVDGQAVDNLADD